MQCRGSRPRCPSTLHNRRNLTPNALPKDTQWALRWRLRRDKADLSATERVPGEDCYRKIFVTVVLEDRRYGLEDTCVLWKGV